MLSHNKNIKDHRLARTARLRSKIEAINQQSQQFNQFYFQLPQVHTAKNASAVDLSRFKPSHQKNNTTETQYSRKNTIKEKIKFRIKQELWNLLKKNNDKQEQKQKQNQTVQTIDQRSFAQQTTFSCVKGQTFTRFNRESFHSKKSWSMVSKAYRQEYDRSKTERQNTPQEKAINRRRLWSSVRVKQNQKLLLFKKSKKMCKNSMSLQRLQVMQIQPWGSPDDTDNQFLD